ncbi:MAG: sensor histidine kinase, partial [Gammaproteobacteria bacterium]|nr:sensor histidine kinase [Gammaproteobacteria bacterium]
QRLRAISENLNIHHFKTPRSFAEWYQHQSGPIQVFSDYELLGEMETGLDVLEKFNIGSNGILVTSHYEDPHITERCQSLQIRLLPKNLLAHIKIVLPSEPIPRNPDLVFIDDDATLCKCWQLSASFSEKSIMTFTSISAFEKKIAEIDPITPIYIDSELGRGLRGEEYAKQLFEQGFHEIYLVTGHAATSFSSMPWIRAIIDKNPPFL